MTEELGALAQLSTRFLHEESHGAWQREWLARDVEGAKLSLAFRTFYQVRGLLPIFARQWLQRIRNHRVVPQQDWYYPESLRQCLSEASIGFPSPWPNQATVAIVLTHDVETAVGVELIDRVASLEESIGFRSSWNIVPYKYRTDPGLIRDLKNRGHEVGVHGYNHDGKLFLSERTFNKRVPFINKAVEDLGATGFRAPMVHRNLHWLQRLNVDYDASCFDVDPLQAMPGGVQTVWPFMVGKLIELPYTMPQDHTLLITLHETSDRIWRDKLQFLCKLHGMALLLTHPDYLDTPDRLRVYASILEHIKEISNYWHVLPSEMAAWTRQQLSAANAGNTATQI